MKRAMNRIGIVLLIMYILLPLFDVVSDFTDYEIIVQAPVFLHIVLVLLAGVVLLWTLLNKAKVTINGQLAAALLPLSMLHALFALPAAGEYCPALSGVACLFIVLWRSTAHKIVKGTSIALTSVGLVLFFLMAIITSVFGSLVAPPEVVKEVLSPDGEHIARLIENDLGYGGGCTVHVGNNLDINLLLCRIAEDGDIVYGNDYFTNVPIEWQNNTTVLIDGEAHTVE